MKKLLFLFIVTIVLSSCIYETQMYSDDMARIPFIKQLDEMYEVGGLTSHFPASWHKKNKGQHRWSSRYIPCIDDSLYHNFSCSAVFVDSASVSYINMIEDTIHYLRKNSFNNDSTIKIDICYMDIIQSYKQESFDTINPPIYNFQDADFLLGTRIDSLFDGTYYCKQEYENLPSDLVVYVIDAQPGNFWRNKELADKEPRPVLPEKWKHGYSRGIGVSRSCERVCWWVIAW